MAETQLLWIRNHRAVSPQLKTINFSFFFSKNTDQKLSSEPTQFKVLKLKEKVQQ